MTTIDFIKSEIKKNCEETAARYEMNLKDLFFGNNIAIYWNEPTLEFSFEDGYVIYSDSDSDGGKEPIGTQFTCAIKTPKGYISSKKINVSVKDHNNVTIDEANELLKFKTDAVKNNFDPFWHENQARRNNTAAWNFIASNYLQDDCR